MKTWILFFFFMTSAQAEVFSAHTCEDTKKIAEEIAELELSGFRWQTSISRCLNQTRFHTLYAQRQDSGDVYLLQPEYLFLPGQEVKIISQTPLPDIDATEVHFGYLAKKFDRKLDQKEVFIRDRFVYRRNYGPNREKMGCISLIEEPEHFVMKEECLKR